MAERFILETLFKASGNLVRQLNTNSRAMQAFARVSNRSLQVVRRGSQLAGKGIDKFGNKYTALVTGAAAAQTGRFLLSLDQRMVRLGIQSNRTSEDMDGLKDSIFDVAQAPDIRIDPTQLLSAVERIVEKTGDLKFASENLRTLGLAIQASGAQGQDIGALVSEFLKLDIKDKPGILTALDTLVSQGKEGAFTLQNLAALGERAVSAFAGLGFKGQRAVQEMGALLQIARIGTGSPEQAATALEAVLRAIVDKGKDLERIDGITIFNPEKLAQGVEEFRPIPEILKDILTVSESRATVLNKVFGAEGLRAINVLAADFKRSGSLETFDKFLQIQGTGATLIDDSARAARSASAAYNSLFVALKRLADETLTGPIQALADAINSLNKDELSTLTKTVAGGTAGLLGLAAARKIAPGAVRTVAGGAARFAGPVGLAGAAGFGVGSLINKQFIEGTELSDAIGAAVAKALAAFGNQEAKIAIELRGEQARNARVVATQSRGFGEIDVTNGPSVVVP